MNLSLRVFTPICSSPNERDYCCSACADGFCSERCKSVTAEASLSGGDPNKRTETSFRRDRLDIHYSYRGWCRRGGLPIASNRQLMQITALSPLSRRPTHRVSSSAVQKSAKVVSRANSRGRQVEQPLPRRICGENRRSVSNRVNVLHFGKPLSPAIKVSQIHSLKAKRMRTMIAIAFLLAHCALGGDRRLGFGGCSALTGSTAFN